MTLMKLRLITLVLPLAVIISCQTPAMATASEPIYESRLSANIPLGSNVYTQLEKLDGLGYINDMRIGAKPYTRIQAASWIKQAAAKQDSQTSPYIQSILAELKREFSKELAVLDGANSASGISLSEWTLGFSRYTGSTLTHQRTESSYQPFAVYSNGYRLDGDENISATMRLEGKLSPNIVVSLTPRSDSAASDHISFPSAYVKTHINNMEIQVGKDSFWWGQGAHGSLLLTNNGEPRKAVKLSTIQPIRFGGIFSFLGQMNATGFFSELEKDRTDVGNPAHVGMRFDFIPADNFTFGIARADLVGGKGHALHSSDYGDWLFGKNSDLEYDKWNAIAGIDFRWRLPNLNGLQIYGEIYGEDQAGVLPPLPRDNAYLLGAYIPRVSPSGDWDAHLEWSETSQSWYDHGLYQEGYVYKGNIMGDAMGNNAYRYYARLTHYLPNGAQLSLHGERVVMGRQLANPQTVSSAWLSLRTNLGQSTFVDATVGKAHVSDQAGSKNQGTFSQIQVSQLF